MSIIAKKNTMKNTSHIEKPKIERKRHLAKTITWRIVGSMPLQRSLQKQFFIIFMKELGIPIIGKQEIEKDIFQKRLLGEL